MTHTRYEIPERIRQFCVAVVVSIVAGVGFVSAQEGPGTMNVSLHLEFSKTSYELGEPVYATARLRNDAGDAIRLATELNPSAGYLSVLVSGPGGGSDRRFVPLSIADLEIEPVAVPPGGELSSAFQMFFGGRGWTFTEAGNYQVTAVLDGLPGPLLRSETVNLEVTPGEGAGRYLFNAESEDQRETGKFLVWQHGDHLRRAHATLEEIISAYPQSPLSNYAQLAIGLNLSRPFSDYNIGRTRPAQPSGALERFQAVDRNGLPDILKARLGLGLARAYIGLDRADDARQAIDAVLEEVSGDSALQRMIQSDMEFDPALQRMN